MPINPKNHAKTSLETPRQSFKGATVLIADDNPANLKLLALLLEKLDLEVVAVKDGNEAVAVANEKKLDIILLDLQMPNLNGLEAARQIRAQSEKNNHTPIIAITAHILSNEKADINEVGFNEYLTKPINEIKLSMLLNKWIKRVSTPIPPAQEPVSITDSSKWPETSFDWEQCIKLAGDKPSLAQALLKMFNEQLPDLRDKIQKAYDAHDHKNLEEHAHKLHGGCCYCGVPKLKAITARFETAIRRHKQETIDTLYHLLMQEIANVLNLIAQSKHEVKEQ